MRIRIVHQKFPWVPAWIPSHENILEAFKSSVDNVVKGKSSCKARARKIARLVAFVYDMTIFTAVKQNRE